jgi:hypothetical protein
VPAADAPLEELPAPERPVPPVALALVEVEVVVEVEAVDGLLVTLAAPGTVNVGAPEVSVVPVAPPPHAETPTASVDPAATAAMIETALRIFLEDRSLVAEWLHPSAADRTVVEILLAQLIAPVAEAKILD